MTERWRGGRGSKGLWDGEAADFGVAHAGNVADGAGGVGGTEAAGKKAVGDGEHALTSVVTSDEGEKLAGAGEHGLDALYARFVGEIAALYVGDFTARQTAPVAFAKQRGFDDGETDGGLEDFGRVNGTAQVAHEEGVEVRTAQRVAQRFGLLYAARRERAREMTLEYGGHVLLSFAVTDEP